MEKRKRSFPLYYDLSKGPGRGRILFADEYEALQKASQPDHLDDEPAQDNVEPAELAAGSPDPAPPATDPADPLDAVTVSGEGYGVPNEVRGDPSLPPDFNRHARRCRVCAHPDRDAIEAEFVRWRSPKNIAKNFKIADYSSIHRHAHATGLFARRRREFARVLEDILECVEDCSLEHTADVIIRAARVYAHLDENGNWVEPPRTHIILTGPAPGQFAENPELEISAVPAQRPHDIPFKLASSLTEQSGANKELASQPSESLIAAHPGSKNGPNS